jgi:hypothetical protein
VGQLPSVRVDVFRRGDDRSITLDIKYALEKVPDHSSADSAFDLEIFLPPCHLVAKLRLRIGIVHDDQYCREIC